MPTKILQCKCRHDFQDKRYGIGQRVHNAMPQDHKEPKYRCTVCSNVKD